MAQINQQFLIHLAQQLVGLGSHLIAVVQPDTTIDDIKKIQDKHYEQSLSVAKKMKRLRQKEEKQEAPPVELTISEDLQEKIDKLGKPEIDLSEEKIEKGVACLACSKEHLAVASGLLDEAARMAKRKEHGMGSSEVKSRVFKAIKEITNMERVDLAPDKTAHLKGKEKELADWASDKTAELRHGITSIKTVDDLMDIAAKTSNAAEKLASDVWDLTLSEGKVDVKINEICRGLSGKALETCRERINAVIQSRK